MPVYLTPTSPSGLLKYEWLDPSGVLRDLTRETSANVFVSRGSKGLGAPGVELVLEKLPFTAGSLVRYTQTRPLEIDLPLVVKAASMAALIPQVRSVRSWFDTGNEGERSPGYLRVTAPDDVERQVACYYAGGLEGDLAEGGPPWTRYVVSLVAPDPHWTPFDATEVEYDENDIYYLGAPAVLPVLNPGDFDAYPIWTITGPATDVTMRNATTGKSWALTGNGGLTLAAGDVLTVDTRPASQRTTRPITNADGFSLYDRVAAGGALWWLAPGTNNLTITASGTSGATVFGLSYLPRYRGALR